MYRTELTRRARKDLRLIDYKVSQRILDKISYFVQAKNPLIYAKKLKNSPHGAYRFRIGNYRAIFDIDESGTITILLILTIKHRRELY